MRWFYLALALLGLSACTDDAPEIGKDLPSNYAEGESVFDARVKARFPVGMSEQRLRAELRRQGFELLAGQFPGDVNVATFYRNELISRTIWSIRWRATGGRVVEIWGVYGVQAP